ncbi:hypothetical protein T190130A13A_60091 [Tenacibaculum sp. 190130A14a]|uniref:Uncharacterized protein n=1 Tax=Tenacibaculum polynesiense TaxID=3137857 RepID=A0ABP1F0S5_9FLAO
MVSISKRGERKIFKQKNHDPKKVKLNYEKTINHPFCICTFWSVCPNGAKQ